MNDGKRDHTLHPCWCGSRLIRAASTEDGIDVWIHRADDGAFPSATVQAQVIALVTMEELGMVSTSYEPIYFDD